MHARPHIREKLIELKLRRWCSIARYPQQYSIPDEALREFYNREWEFRTTLLADFNKLTIAVAVAAAVFFDKYPSVFYAFIVTCFIMIVLYAAAYLGQRDISKQYYRDAGKRLTPTYKSSYDAASKYLQAIFGVAIIVVLCLMIRAERMTKPGGSNDLEKTRPYNPPTKVQDTRPYNPPKIEPEKQIVPPTTPPSPPEKKK